MLSNQWIGIELAIEEAAQQFCAEQVESGIHFFGGPVQYDASGPLSGVTAR